MSDRSKVKGRIIRLEETKTYGSRGFKKRLMVIETNQRYPQTIPVEATGDKCELFDGFQEGEEVTVHVNICGRAWKDRYFVSLAAWKIQLEGERATAGRLAPRSRQRAILRPPATTFRFSSENT